MDENSLNLMNFDGKIALVTLDKEFKFDIWAFGSFLRKCDRFLKKKRSQKPSD